MRDINRIDNFCNELAKYWKQVPDLRFGQLIINIFGSCEKDPWFYEEDEMLKVFENFFKEEKK
jgi:hypothetical protein